MGYQFIHLESYARASSAANKKERKRSAIEIIGEAERTPGHFERHIKEANRPIILPGFLAPSVALAEAEVAALTVKDSQGRKLRKDAPILLAGVISVDAGNSDRWPAIRNDSIKYLREKYGDRLRSVVEHTDEANPHIHFYIVPKAGERALDLHPGHCAKKAAGGRKSTKAGALNAAYVEAMTRFQMEFESAVGVWHGLTRIGPRRRRLTRKEWQMEKKAATDRAEAFKAASEVAAEFQRRVLAEVAKLPQPVSNSGETSKNQSQTTVDPLTAQFNALAAASRAANAPLQPATPRPRLR